MKNASVFWKSTLEGLNGVFQILKVPDFPQACQRLWGGKTGLRLVCRMTFAALILMSGNGPATASGHPGVSTVGYVQLSDPNVHNELIAATAEALRREMGDAIRFKAYTVRGLVEALRQGELDFVFSTSGFYRENMSEGLKDLATSAYSKGPDPNHSQGSIFIARKERTDLRTLSDLRGKSVSALAESSFVGWQIAARELILNGYDPYKFWGSIRRVSMPMDHIVQDVLSGRADVGILRACQLEEYRLEGFPGIENVRGIALKTSPGFFCEHSTTLYAAYTFSAVAGTDGAVARRVTSALFSMPPTPKSEFTWSVATDFTEVDALLQDLKIGPYAYLRHMNFFSLLKKYWPAPAFLLLVILGMVLHTCRTQYLIKVRTAELSKSLQTQKRLQREASENSRRLEMLEKEAALQHMTGVLAHELKQPLTAISYFVNGVIRRLKRGDANVQALIETLDRVSKLTKNSSAIIDTVQGAMHRKTRRQWLDLSSLVNQIMEAYQHSALFSSPCRLCWKTTDDAWIYGSEFEVTLLLLNLVKNAVEAVEESSDGAVEVALGKCSYLGRAALELSVSDNGPGTPRDIEKALSTPFVSAKENGMGLGLLIAKRIVESYGGRLSVSPNCSRGLTFHAILVAEHEDKDNSGPKPSDGP